MSHNIGEANYENILRSKDKGGGTTTNIKQLLRRTHRESKVFALIELLIVIAILGILAAVVLSNVI